MMNAEQSALRSFCLNSRARRGGERVPWREELKLIPELAACLRALTPGQARQVEELRLYGGREAELVVAGRTVMTGVRLNGPDFVEQVAALTGYALYRCERQMAQGYIPLAGGHRAGVCGRMARQEDGSWRMAEVTSVCLRISHALPGASRGIQKYLLDGAGRARRVLLLGAPGCGKTTALRDAALYLANGAGLHVAVADEREELFPDLPGGRIDVLAGCGRAQAISMLLRAMAPQVIVTDELGGEADATALEDAARCGVGVLASAHADGLDGLRARPALRALFESGAFERYIHLGRRCVVLHVWDAGGSELDKEGMRRGQLGYGCDGDDRDQCGGVSAVGRGEAARAVDSGDAPLSAADERDHPL